jgi:hypothetical protein
MIIQLDQLVRRIPKEEYDSNKDDHFIYNPSTNSCENKTKPSFWTKFTTGQLQYYEVVCSANATPNASGTIPPIGVKDPDSDVWLRINVMNYDAWILPENAKDIICAVASDNPGKQLVVLVVDSIQRQLSREPGVLSSDLADIVRELERQLLREYGLNIILKLRLDESSPDENVSKSLPKIEFDIPVQLGDYSQELNLRVFVVTCVQDPARAFDAINRRPDFKETIQRSCREFFIDVGLQEFRSQLAGTLRDSLRRHLEKEIAPWFLRLRTIHIELLSKLPDVIVIGEEETTFAIYCSGKRVCGSQREVVA